MNTREAMINQSDVALRLSKHVLETEGKDKNVILSPASISVVLALIATGSKDRTLEQILSFLGFESADHLRSSASELVSVLSSDESLVGGPQLSFVNGAWVEKSVPLSNSFKQILENSYKAAISQVDFFNKAPEVLQEVNSWAEKETNGLVKNLLPPNSVDSSTRLILANALYFKGAWETKFDVLRTEDRDFYLMDGSSVKVPFMTSRKDQLVETYDGFKVLGLPYKQGNDYERRFTQGNYYWRRFTMYILLPDAKAGLSALVNRAGSEPGFLDRHLPRERREVDNFIIPKFKITFEFEASDILKGMGLTAPFCMDGGLSEMVDSPVVGQLLYVSKIFHKSAIEVDEKGTEAAAATAAVIKFGCAMRTPRERVDFVADHPFMFLVREDATGTVLFSGHVLNPLQQADP